MTIHDVQGRLVRTLVDGAGEAASHVVMWDGTNDGRRPLGSGVCYVRLESDGRVESRSLVLAR